MAIAFGADRLAAEPALVKGAGRVALATNDAARSAHDPRVAARATLLSAGIPIVRLFSPEHGLHMRAPDGAAVGDATDALTGLPVVSLYGERFGPLPESLADLDAVLFDVPDVGARCYTYTWTLTHLLDACAAARIPLYVLDRPNPLSGALHTVEGPLLDEHYYSFLGRHSIPIRHALTLGELARLWQSERRPDVDLRVIRCAGWQRDQLWSDTGLPYVPTSPAIANFEAALLYPGLSLFEATNLSVGRGTAHAFRAVGAPWLDAASVIELMADRALPGIQLEPARFTPASPPHAGKRCEGVSLLISQAHAVRPVTAGIALLADIAASHGGYFEWAPYPTAANPAGEGHLERLIGSSEPRALIDRAAAPLSPTVLARLTASPGWARRWQLARLYQ